MGGGEAPPVQARESLRGCAQRGVSGAHGSADATPGRRFLPAGANLAQTPVPHALCSSVLLCRASAGTSEQLQRLPSSRRPRNSKLKGIDVASGGVLDARGSEVTGPQAPPPGSCNFRSELLLES